TLTVAGYGLFRLVGRGWRAVRGRTVDMDWNAQKYLNELAAEDTLALSSDVLRPGTPVRVMRSSGALEEGWQIVQIEANGGVLTTGRGGLTKVVSRRALFTNNPELIPRQMEVRVRRSSGAVEDGWLVQG